MAYYRLFCNQKADFQSRSLLPQDNVLLLENDENLFYRRMMEMRLEETCKCLITIHQLKVVSISQASWVRNKVTLSHREYSLLLGLNPVQSGEQFKL